MSTTSLPGYRPPSCSTPTYSAEPQAYERRLALSRLRQRRPVSDFVKQSRSGGISLRLSGQEDCAGLPLFGRGHVVKGVVSLSKPEAVTTVELKIEGNLRLKEIAEGGTTTNKLCSTTTVLWSREANAEPCSHHLPFIIKLPLIFSDGREEYPLPPTHEAHLSGVPGFYASIEYTIGAVVQKGRPLRIGDSAVSTEFVYYPRSRPAIPLPPPIGRVLLTSPILTLSDWRCYDSVIGARTPSKTDITVRLYIPASRIFCVSEPLPFYVTFESSAQTLASFLPYSPTKTRHSSKAITRIQILRQTNVDVRNGPKTDIWCMSDIGEGTFRHAGNGQDWISFCGEIQVNSEVTIGGFRAGGLTIKDFIVLSMTPPEPAKAPFSELRQLVPIRLTTDPWTSDAGEAFSTSDHSIHLISPDPPPPGKTVNQSAGRIR